MGGNEVPAERPGGSASCPRTAAVEADPRLPSDCAGGREADTGAAGSFSLAEENHAPRQCSSPEILLASSGLRVSWRPENPVRVRPVDPPGNGSRYCESLSPPGSVRKMVQPVAKGLLDADVCGCGGRDGVCERMTFDAPAPGGAGCAAQAFPYRKPGAVVSSQSGRPGQALTGKKGAGCAGERAFMEIKKRLTTGSEALESMVQLRRGRAFRTGRLRVFPRRLVGWDNDASRTSRSWPILYAWTLRRRMRCLSASGDP